MTIQEFLQHATKLLQATIASPRLEAELLLAHALNKPRSYLHAWPETILTTNVLAQVQTDLARRLANEPMAYIVGKKEFWSLELKVDSNTLIPRPETEILVAAILNQFTATNIKMADLGTGSGAIAIAIAKERPHWEVIATDISAKALQVAVGNADALGINNIYFYQGDWCDALPARNFSLIVSNPPYIAEVEWVDYATSLQFEPRQALVSGVDGLTAIRALIQQCKTYLLDGGCLCMEHGYQQGESVRELMQQAGYRGVQTLVDLAGLERATLGVVKK